MKGLNKNKVHRIGKYADRTYYAARPQVEWKHTISKFRRVVTIARDAALRRNVRENSRDQ